MPVVPDLTETDRHTHRPSTVTLAAHVRRGLIKYWTQNVSSKLYGPFEVVEEHSVLLSCVHKLPDSLHIFTSLTSSILPHHLQHLVVHGDTNIIFSLSHRRLQWNLRIMKVLGQPICFIIWRFPLLRGTNLLKSMQMVHWRNFIMRGFSPLGEFIIKGSTYNMCTDIQTYTWIILHICLSSPITRQCINSHTLMSEGLHN